MAPDVAAGRVQSCAGSGDLGLLRCSAPTNDSCAGSGTTLEPDCKHLFHRNGTHVLILAWPRRRCCRVSEQEPRPPSHASRQGPVVPGCLPLGAPSATCRICCARGTWARRVAGPTSWNYRSRFDQAHGPLSEQRRPVPRRRRAARRAAPCQPMAATTSSNGRTATPVRERAGRARWWRRAGSRTPGPLRIP